LFALWLHPAIDSPEPRTVLVVEDDDVTRAFLLDNLAADGFRVAGASGAGEGLRAIEVRQPALVVLDRVRSADGLASRIDPDLPVIVLTGRSGRSGQAAPLLQRAVRMGVRHQRRLLQVQSALPMLVGPAPYLGGLRRRDRLPDRYLGAPAST
jgi:DNA-binding NtrC family response regulator